MNILGFDYAVVSVNLVGSFIFGMAFGSVYHLLRFLILHIIERKGV